MKEIKKKPAPVKELTIKQAAHEHGMPESRIRNAIYQGWLNTLIKKGKHVFSEKHFLKAICERKFYVRHDRTINIVWMDRFLLIENSVEKFATTGGADEFVNMLSGYDSE